MNYDKLLEMSSFFTWYIFLEVGKTQDMPSKIWQTLGDALTCADEAAKFWFSVILEMGTYAFAKLFGTNYDERSQHALPSQNFGSKPNNTHIQNA